MDCQIPGFEKKKKNLQKKPNNKKPTPKQKERKKENKQTKPPKIQNKQRKDRKTPLQFCQEIVNICFARIIGKIVK